MAVSNIHIPIYFRVPMSPSHTYLELLLYAGIYLSSSCIASNHSNVHFQASPDGIIWLRHSNGSLGKGFYIYEKIPDNLIAIFRDVHVRFSITNDKREDHFTSYTWFLMSV